MPLLLSDLGVGLAAFVSTNIDDIFLLAAFFADSRLRRRSIVIGQYLGIGTLVLASALAALLALALPAGWVALLGCVPLFLGIRMLLVLRADTGDGECGGDEPHSREWWTGDQPGLRSQALAVAGVTIANGGDNIGVYVPLFATAPDAIAAYVLVFAIMTGIWCVLGFALVNNRILGATIRRYGQTILPVVLIALGIYILSGALVLIS